MEIDESFPMRQEFDAEILMHRDAHFGGNFKIMLDYYEKRGKGVRPEFEIEQIRNLAEFEQLSGKNLALFILSESEIEQVAHVQESYQALRKLSEQKNPIRQIPQLIANLILSEEEDPVQEIEAVVQQKSIIVPALIELLTSEMFHDPLFPGYGLAPILAAQCLGRIGDKRAIISIFEALKGDDFFNEDTLLRSLKLIGEPAKAFLLQVVKGRPVNEDNERAAIALFYFKEDPEVTRICLELLQNPFFRKDQVLVSYLIFVCEGMKNVEDRLRFRELMEDPELPSFMKSEMQNMVRAWTESEGEQA